MYNLILFLGICAALALGSKLPVVDKKVEKIVGCYYRINLKYDNAGPALEIGDIDVSLCTHIFYSFAVLNANAFVEMFDPYADIDGFKQFNGLRKKNLRLKTLIAIGDLTDVTDSKVTNVELLTSPTLREKLVNNIFNFVKKYEFNGVSLKLRDPPKPAGSHSVKKNLVLFLKTLREKFDKERLILSATVTPDEAIAEILYDIKGISTYVDFINLQTIDLHEGSDAEKKIGVGHSSPIYPSSRENAGERKKNIDSVVKYWISQGASPGKLVLGTPFYGISYTLANPKQIGRGAPFIKNEEYCLPYRYVDLCDLIKKWNHLYDKEQQVPYIYNGNEIIAYDDVESIKKKAEYAKKMKLGGVVVWTIDDDDFFGKCGEKFPLLKTLNQVFRNRY